MNSGSLLSFIEWCDSRKATSQGATKPLRPAKAILLENENGLQEGMKDKAAGEEWYKFVD